MSFYNNASEDMAKAYLGIASAPTGTLKLALMTTSYTFDETDVYYSDLSGEASGTGYTTGGQAVNNVTVTQSDANDGAIIDYDTEVFSGITVTNVNGCVLYFDTGTPGTSKLVEYKAFTEGAQTIVAGNFTVTPNASGVTLIARA